MSRQIRQFSEEEYPDEDYQQASAETSNEGQDDEESDESKEQKRDNYMKTSKYEDEIEQRGWTAETGGEDDGRRPGFAR